MKTIVTTAAAAFFATSLNAADTYRQMGFGKPDLSPEPAPSGEIVAVQPDVGGGQARYAGEGNLDAGARRGSRATSSARPSGEGDVIYVGPGRRF